MGGSLSARNSPRWRSQLRGCGRADLALSRVPLLFPHGRLLRPFLSSLLLRSPFPRHATSRSPAPKGLQQRGARVPERRLQHVGQRRGRHLKPLLKPPERVLQPAAAQLLEEPRPKQRVHRAPERQALHQLPQVATLRCIGHWQGRLTLHPLPHAHPAPSRVPAGVQAPCPGGSSPQARPRPATATAPAIPPRGPGPRSPAAATARPAAGAAPDPASPGPAGRVATAASVHA